MGILYLHQLREHFGSLRVQLGLLVVVLFFAVNGLTSAWRLEQQVDQEARYGAEAEKRYDVSSVSQAAASWYQLRNQPSGTEFIAEGGFKWMWGSFNFTPEGGVPPWWYLARDVNFWMTPFENIDWLLIARVVLSFLCLVLAYDGISGEAERGTLRQVLANPLSRARVLAAKYLAGLSVLMTATVLGAVVSLLVLSLHGALQLSGNVAAGIGFYLLGTALYLSLFLFLSLGVSALTRSSVSSLVLLTLAWAVLVVVVPQLSYLVAMRTVEVSDDRAQAQWDLYDQTLEALRQDGLAPRDPQLAAADGYAVEQRYARQLDDLEKGTWRRTREGYDRQLVRFRVARAVNLTSPGYAFQYATEALLGAGIAKRQSFLEQAWRQRDAVRAFLRGRDAADPDSPHLLWLPRFLSQAKMDGRDIPRLAERPPTAAERFAWGWVPLLALVLEAVAACLFAVWAVNRADVTGYAMAEA